jgi:hypothetical protein
MADVRSERLMKASGLSYSMHSAGTTVGMVSSASICQEIPALSSSANCWHHVFKSLISATPFPST